MLPLIERLEPGAAAPPLLARAAALADGAFRAVATDGRALGHATCVVWDPRASLGLVADDPEAALALASAALGAARDAGARAFVLDAPAALRAPLESLGFAARGESALWEGRARVSWPLPPSGGDAIYPVSSAEIMELLAYDTPRFGANRARLVAALVAEEPHRSFVSVDRKTGAFSGLALAHREGIGPVVADSPEAAAWLLHACERARAPARAWVPAWHPRAEALLAAAGYAPGTRFVRMTMGEPSREREDTLYALAGLGLG